MQNLSKLIVVESDLNHLMRPRKVCLCRDVSREQIIAAVRNGARTLAAIQKDTLAATGCGTCLPSVLEVLDDALRREADEKIGQRRLDGL